MYPQHGQKALKRGYWQGEHINRRYLRNDKATWCADIMPKISLTKIHHLLINPADNAYQEIVGKSFPKI